MRKQQFNEYAAFRRLEIAIRELVRNYGFNGDPLAPKTPEVGTLEEQLAIANLYQSIPAILRLDFEEEATAMLRAAVLSSEERRIA